ncbi:hypothetical protein ATANTOWER_000350 [Ataeniobius toweri]|uniref:Uncharacterized protein n=1 Tax=Ataeniobius toweri TaxID=208326 RepID=A0ABU7B535_9TELE|nr:hypothetical protein [Ataeniobius toweri]
MKQMPRPPQLTCFDVAELRLYSEPLPDGRAPHPISKGVPGHPTEEAHFGRLYPGSRTFGHDPKFMPIDEGRNVGRPVNPKVCLSAQLSLYHNGPVQRPHYCSSHTNLSVNLLP